MTAGYVEEAEAWREWLLRAVAGSPAQLQIMYGLAGERRLPERELPWLPGYEAQRPVRIGNAAHRAVSARRLRRDAGRLYQSRAARPRAAPTIAWRVEQALLDFLEIAWQRARRGHLGGARAAAATSPIPRSWPGSPSTARSRPSSASASRGRSSAGGRCATTIHAEVCAQWLRPRAQHLRPVLRLDGPRCSLLLIPLVGFLPPTTRASRHGRGDRARADASTASSAAIDRGEAVDGLPPGEGAFLACSFWLADNYAMIGPPRRGAGLFERLLALRNDVGLLAEEYDPRDRRQLGNFPQAFSHVALVNTAHNLTTHLGPADSRADAIQAAETVGALD